MLPIGPRVCFHRWCKPLYRFVSYLSTSQDAVKATELFAIVCPIVWPVLCGWGATLSSRNAFHFKISCKFLEPISRQMQSPMSLPPWPNFHMVKNLIGDIGQSSFWDLGKIKIISVKIMAMRTCVAEFYPWPHKRMVAFANAILKALWHMRPGWRAEMVFCCNGELQNQPSLASFTIAAMICISSTDGASLVTIVSLRKAWWTCCALPVLPWDFGLFPPVICRFWTNLAICCDWSTWWSLQGTWLAWSELQSWSYCSFPGYNTDKWIKYINFAGLSQHPSSTKHSREVGS